MVKASLHSPKGAWRGNRRRGSLNTTLQSCSQGHPWSQPITSPSSQAQRSIGAQVGTQIKKPKKGAPYPGPCQGSPSRASAQCPIILRGLLPAAEIQGLQGKLKVCDPTGLITGCLGGKPKMGQRSSLGDLGRNKCGNTEGMKRASHVWALGWSVSLPVPVLHVISAICPAPQ